MTYQQGILNSPVPVAARHLFFSIHNSENAADAVHALAKMVDGENLVVGFGVSLLQALFAEDKVEKLRAFEPLSNQGIDVPSTQYALWCWLHGDDRGELLHRSQELIHALSPAFSLELNSESFRYLSGHDLSGYEDGTENPVDDEAIEAAFDYQSPYGSYAAIQHWQHDLAKFKSFPQGLQDHIIGRQLSDNEEIEDAPEFAHVKRTAMEDFEPEAFLVRRSMPYIDGDKAGLIFLAFGHSLRAFDVQMRRMMGFDDGILDGLFQFSRPITGGYYWCPPMKGGQLDLSVL